MKKNCDGVGEKIQKYLKFIDDEMERGDQHFIHNVSERTSKIIESKIYQDPEFIDDVKIKVINKLVQELKNNLKN